MYSNAYYETRDVSPKRSGGRNGDDRLTTADAYSFNSTSLPPPPMSNTTSHFQQQPTASSRVDFGVYKAPPVNITNTSSSYYNPYGANHANTNTNNTTTMMAANPPRSDASYAAMPSRHYAEGYNANTSLAASIMGHGEGPAPPSSSAAAAGLGLGGALNNTNSVGWHNASASAGGAVVPANGFWGPSATNDDSHVTAMGMRSGLVQTPLSPAPQQYYDQQQQQGGGGGGDVSVVHHHYYNGGGGGGDGGGGGLGQPVVHNHHYNGGGGGGAAPSVVAGPYSQPQTPSMQQIQQQQQYAPSLSAVRPASPVRGPPSSLPNHLYLQQLHQPSYQRTYGQGSESVLNASAGTGGVFTAGKVSYAASPPPPPAHYGASTSYSAAAGPYPPQQQQQQYAPPQLSVPHPSAAVASPTETYFSSNSAGTTAYPHARPSMGVQHSGPAYHDMASSPLYAPHQHAPPHYASVGVGDGPSLHLHSLSASTAASPLVPSGPSFNAAAAASIRRQNTYYNDGMSPSSPASGGGGFNPAASFASAASSQQQPPYYGGEARDGALPAHIVNHRLGIKDQFNRSMEVMQNELRGAHIRSLLVVLQDDEARVRNLIIAEENREVAHVANYSNTLDEVLHAFNLQKEQHLRLIDEEITSSAEGMLRAHYAKILKGEQHRQKVVDTIVNDREHVRERSSMSRTPSRRREVSQAIGQRQRSELAERERRESAGRRGSAHRQRHGSDYDDDDGYEYDDGGWGDVMVRGARSLRRMSAAGKSPYPHEAADGHDGELTYEEYLIAKGGNERSYHESTRRPQPPSHASSSYAQTPNRSRWVPRSPTRGRFADLEQPPQHQQHQGGGRPLSADRGRGRSESMGRGGGATMAMDASSIRAQSPYSAAMGSVSAADATSEAMRFPSAQRAASVRQSVAASSPSRVAAAASPSRAAAARGGGGGASVDKYSNRFTRLDSGGPFADEREKDILDYRPSSAIKRRDSANRRPMSPSNTSRMVRFVD